MTDLQKLRELLVGFDVPYFEEYSDPDHPNCLVLTITVRSNEKVVGYSNFITEFVFNEDDSFKHVGIWE